MGPRACGSRSPRTVPVAYLSARLCDVFPDGTSALAGRGVLNLTHRDGHDAPVALEPGVPAEVEIELEATSWVFEPGHRVRLALAGADWPNTWPPPIRLAAGRSTWSVELVLPVLAGPRRCPPPGLASDDRHGHACARHGRPQPRARLGLEDDVVGHESRAVTSYGSTYEAPSGARVDERYDGVVGVSQDDPALAWARGGPSTGSPGRRPTSERRRRSR